VTPTDELVNIESECNQLVGLSTSCDEIDVVRRGSTEEVDAPGDEWSCVDDILYNKIKSTEERERERDQKSKTYDL